MDFDPVALLAQQTGVDQQALLAKMLRQQAGGGQVQMPEGQMVSGHYVAPSITQQLAAVINPLLGQYTARNAENELGQKQAVLQQTIAKAQQDWAQQMPQGTPGQAAVAPVQGAPIERGGQANPEAVGQPAVAPQLPSALQRLQYAMAGSQIPGNGPNAAAYLKVTGDEVAREDNQQAKKDAQVAELAFRKQQLEAQMAEKRGTAAEMLAWRREHDQILLQIAAMNASAAGNKSGLTPSQQATEDRFEEQQTQDIINKLTPMTTLARRGQVVQDMLDAHYSPETKTYKPIPGIGFESKLGRAMGAAEAVGAVKPGASTNNAKVRAYLNSVLKSNAGLSQTITEQANTLQEALAGGDYKQDQFITGWKNLMRLMQEDISQAVNRGMPRTKQILKERNIQTTGVTSKYDDYGVPADDGQPATLGTPQGVSQVANDEEYNRLPKGAKYMGPDGVLRVK
jgi:hypothetical protein